MVTGVSAQKALVERAVAEQAQLVLVHHGLFWEFHPPGLTPTLAERLRPLFKHDVALAAYHLPLDGHPELGNNAILAERLGCERHEPFRAYRGTPIGRAGTFPGDGIPRRPVRARARADRPEPTVFAGARPGAPDRHRVGQRRLCAAGGDRARLDAFLTASRAST